jgi:hypothetical protein
MRSKARFYCFSIFAFVFCFFVFFVYLPRSVVCLFSLIYKTYTMSALSSAKKKYAATEQALSLLLKIPGNASCADCFERGPRWASWNLGVFLCIRCGGIHRKMGTHISKVKSVTLDKWEQEHVAFMEGKKTKH